MLSPKNCALEGTTRAFLEVAIKKTEITITEKKTSNAGFVKNSESPNIGRKMKS